VLPFLKWAGGKRWLFDAAFVKALPPHRRYIEPFLGGGAGFFAVAPEESVLSDVNSELVDLYAAVRDYPCELKQRLAELQETHGPEQYYLTRASSPTTGLERAVRSLYLNRTCWNGLYRLNKKGEFNVPIGTKTAIVLPTDDFQAASYLLRNTKLRCADFEAVIDDAGDGDLIFADPPYTVKHNLNGFVKYNERLFAWDDQIRLKHALVRAVERGARVVLTNADHMSLATLYEGVGRHERAYRSSIISGKAAGRVPTSELVITI
jgi:DNA adenine methylase